jgi:pimeloyl-ACP methyl ester carboxylesterase
MIAAELAAMQPDRFDRLVLIAPLGLWDPTYPVLDFFAADPADLGRALYHDPESPVARAARDVPRDGDPYIQFMLDRAKSLATAAKYLWPIPNRGLGKRIHRVTMPTLLVWGASDGVCPPRYGEDFHRLIPGSELAILERAGHLPQVERPDELGRVVSPFLKRG